MKKVCCFMLVLVLQPQSHCYENNVCKTIQDYYTIKGNPNCEYDVAADPDSDLITVIKFYGYPAETHEVITSDGYILSMVRILNHHASVKNSPVIMQPGWLNSGSVFLGLRNNSLAFLLADAGYDVWLCNPRGSEYSEGHVNLTVHNEQYWDYSVDEMALIDVPAQLDYISEATGNKGDIVYIGYSLGSGTGVIYSSSFPEKARKTLRMLILLAPGAYLGHMISPLFRYTRPLLTPLYQLVKANDLIRLTSQGKILKSLTSTFCFESPLLLQRCIQLADYLFAGPKSEVKPETLPVVFNQSPAGATFKIVSQLGDFLLGNFRRYDYGKKNLEIYGSYEPPSYEVGRIQVPVFVVHAINDWAVTPKDVGNFYNNLSPEVRYGRYEIRVPNFNHYDFMYGSSAKKLVYNVVLQVLNKIQY